MTATNFDRTLRAFQRRAPFRPFTVELVSGSRFRIEHPEALVVRAGVAVFIAPDGDLTIFDHEGVSKVVEERSSRKSR